MLNIQYSLQFKKDYKKIIKRGYNPTLLENVLKILITYKALPTKYKEHNLSGKYKDYKECHITPDWLLIYKTNQSTLTLILTRTGTHSDLF